MSLLSILIIALIASLSRTDGYRFNMLISYDSGVNGSFWGWGGAGEVRKSISKGIPNEIPLNTGY